MNKYLVDDWRDCWRWISMHSMALSVALLGAWVELPDDIRQAMPSWLLPALVIVVLVLGMIGRVMRQETPKSGDASP